MTDERREDGADAAPDAVPAFLPELVAAVRIAGLPRQPLESRSRTPCRPT